MIEERNKNIKRMRMREREGGGERQRHTKRQRETETIRPNVQLTPADGKKETIKPPLNFHVNWNKENGLGCCAFKKACS